ncbi:MAG: FAD:protein FMN transferase, partial [Oscillospiraceae bacterium]
MRNKTKNLIFAALFIVATTAVCIYSIHQKELFKPASSVDFIMNTVVEQRLYGKNSEKAVQQVTNALADFEKLLSTYVVGSEIDQINKAAGEHSVKISPTTMELLLLSKDYCESSGGLVDITIAPLILEWGITSDNPHVPSKETINSLLKLVNHKELVLDEQQSTAMLLNKGQAIDLGAIAKGYSCDIFRRVTQENGIKSGYASIGGNMVVIGKNPDGTDFRFGIRDPRGDETKYIGSLSLEGKTMATSGDYERFFMENGVRYHHIL